MSPRHLMRTFAPAVLIVVAGLAASSAVSAESLTVAAASDLQSALPAIVASYEKATGQKVTVTYGSSGNFFTQIENGAPFDVFLSADLSYPKQLERSGRAELGTLFEYATGRIVLWARNDSGLDVRKGLGVLADRNVQKIAIANPAHAPYGRAAVAALRHEGIYERVREKLVMGENVSQAVQFVESGNAQAGLIALSLALAPALSGAGSYFEIPPSFHPPIAQAAVVLAASHQKAAAQRFVDALKKPEVARILQANGFSVAMTAAR